MTNGWVCATIDMGDRRSFLVTGHGVPVTKRPASVREEVTSGHICDGPRPLGVGQSPDQVTEVGRTAPAAIPNADNSTERHRQDGPIASRVTRQTTRPEPS